MADLSEACFHDRCRDCHWPGCGDICHRDETFDWPTGEWAPVDEEGD